MNKEPDWLEALLERRLLLHVGKGGVGRSAVSAALAKLAAARGKRVLVCEVNAKERMSSLLGGTPPSEFTTLDEVWQPQERIWAVNIRPWPAMKEYISEVLRMRLVFNLVFENSAMRYFLRAVPGLQELVYIGKVWFHTTQELENGRPRYDLVIVDAPATGHGLAMLRIPQVILEVAPAGPMRSATQRIQELLLDEEKTWINMVTLPEEMPVNETIELHEKLVTMLGLPIGVTWMNQWPAPPCPAAQIPLLEALMEEGLQTKGAWPHFAAASAALHTYQRAQRHLEALQEQIDRPVYCIPKLAPAAAQDSEGTFHERAVADGLASFIREATAA